MLQIFLFFSEKNLLQPFKYKQNLTKWSMGLLTM